MTDKGRPVPDHASGPVFSLVDQEICRCGDFRWQHERGTGRCKLGSLCKPWPCQQFRLL